MNNIHVATIRPTLTIVGGAAVESDYDFTVDLYWVNSYFCHPQMVASALEEAFKLRAIETMNAARIRKDAARPAGFVRNLERSRARMADFRAAISACSCCKAGVAAMAARAETFPEFRQYFHLL